jgi:adenosylcobinamide-GDP ribazoletransferase
VRHDVAVAFVFLTRLRFRLRDDVGMRDLAAAAYAFPLVGACIGLTGGVAYLLGTTLGLAPLLAAGMAVTAMLAVTGALHEDGLADTADGLAAGSDRERALAIMRDSRIGSYGTLALILVVAGRLAALAELAASVRVALALITAAAFSRAMMALVMRYQPSARADGLAAAAGRPSTGPVVTAAAATILCSFLLLPWRAALPALFAAVVIGSAAAAFLGHRIGGCTGDTLGAVQQLTELAFLIVLTL